MRARRLPHNWEQDLQAQQQNSSMTLDLCQLALPAVSLSYQAYPKS